MQESVDIASKWTEENYMKLNNEKSKEMIISFAKHGNFRHTIYIIKEKLETLSSMESYLPTSDRHAASWIFSDGPSKQLGVVKLRYNALKLFFIMSLFYANVPVSASDSHSRQFLSLTQAQL